jgi:zinc and cadmium transporter
MRVGFLRTSLVVFLVSGLSTLSRGDDSPSPREHQPGHVHRHGHDHGREAHDGSPAADSLPTPASTAGLWTASARRWPLILLGLYCLAIIGASLLGGWLPQLMNLTHTQMQVLISFISGLMLGIGVFHMLPHALVELGDDGPDLAAYGMMAGLIIMFLLLRVFHFHHHGPAEVHCKHEDFEGSGSHRHTDGDHHHGDGALSTEGHSLNWMGVFLGMTLHTLIDGLAVGASVAGDALHSPTGLLGFGTFMAVVLHKPLDSVSITSVMAAGGWSRGSRTLVNASFSLICPLGAVLFVLGVGEFSGRQSLIVGCALALSAGVFLCIALSDLLPEMEFHSHSRLPLTIALVAGVALAWSIRFLEPEHAHSHHHAEAGQAHPQLLQ